MDFGVLEFIRVSGVQRWSILVARHLYIDLNVMHHVSFLVACLEAVRSGQ